MLIKRWICWFPATKKNIHTRLHWAVVKCKFIFSVSGNFSWCFGQGHEKGIWRAAEGVVAGGWTVAGVNVPKEDDGITARRSRNRLESRWKIRRMCSYTRATPYTQENQSIETIEGIVSLSITRDMSIHNAYPSRGKKNEIHRDRRVNDVHAGEKATKTSTEDKVTYRAIDEER